MVEIRNTYRYKDVKKSSICDNVFFVMQNNETGLYYSNKHGGVENLSDATRYKSIGILKSVINKIYFPKNLIMLQMLEDAGVWTRKELPEDTFDEFFVHEVVVNED